jgi:hypothetical protein
VFVKAIVRVLLQRVALEIREPYEPRRVVVRGGDEGGRVTGDGRRGESGLAARDVGRRLWELGPVGVKLGFFCFYR